MKKSLFITLVIGIFIGSISFVNSEETKNEDKWIPITSFKIGIGENEIPNSDEGAELYFSPRNLFLDSKGNIYIFIFGTNQIKKLSSSGKLINNYTINNYGLILSIYLDITTDKIYALTTSSEIIIFNSEMNLFGKIKCNNLVKTEKVHPEKIKVINEKAYVFLGVKSSLYVIDIKNNLNNDIVRYEKLTHLHIDNAFLDKIKPHFYPTKEEASNAIYFKKKQETINFPSDVNFVSFLTCTDSSLFLLTESPTASIKKYIDKIFIVNKDGNIMSIELVESSLIQGNEIPLVSIDKNEHIYYLCCENDKYVLYFYRL